MNVSCTTSECPVLLNSSCVFYEGANLAFTGILTNDSVQTAIQKINTKMAESGGGTVTSVTASLPLSSSGGTTPNITISLATTASNGYLSATDWNNFNNKQGTVSLTTTGTSGAATFIANVLNIPQYQAAGAYVTSVSGTTDRITSSGGTTPVIDIAVTYAGQTSIVTLGTVTTGTWGATIIAATVGGTGQSTVTTGDILQGVGANIWGKLGAVATGNVLISQGVGTASIWGKVDLTTHVTGILPIANGGTGSATNNVFWRAADGVTLTGSNTITQAVSTSGSPTMLTFVGAAHTTLTASTEAPDINYNLARTVQFATGNITTQRAFRIQAPTYAFVGASTISNAATVSISGAPAEGTNAVITRPCGLLIGTTTVPGTSIGTMLAVKGTSGHNVATFESGASTSGFVVSATGNFAAYGSNSRSIESGLTGGFLLSTTYSLKFNGVNSVEYSISETYAGGHTFNHRAIVTEAGIGSDVRTISLTSTFAPTSGTNTYVDINIIPTYNFTGGTREVIGINYFPTLTDVTGVTHFALKAVSGCILLGDTTKSTNTGDKVLILSNASTNATGAQTNGIVIHSKDSSDGAANATLALYLEQAPEATATFTQTHRLKVWINAVEYWLSLDAV